MTLFFSSFTLLPVRIISDTTYDELSLSLSLSFFFLRQTIFPRVPSQHRSVNHSWPLYCDEDLMDCTCHITTLYPLHAVVDEYTPYTIRFPEGLRYTTRDEYPRKNRTNRDLRKFLKNDENPHRSHFCGI